MGFRLFMIESKRLLIIITIAIIIIGIYQCSLLPYKKIFPLSPVYHGSRLNPNNLSSVGSNGSHLSPIDEEIGDKDDLNTDHLLSLKVDTVLGKDGNFSPAIASENGLEDEGIRYRDGIAPLLSPGTSSSLMTANASFADKILEIAKMKPEKNVSFTMYRNRRKGLTTSISQMNSLLLQSHNSSHCVPQKSSVRQTAFLSAKLKVENAPIVRNYPGHDFSAFRNLSRFLRSYELMERTLKIYIYKEGEKPIFHQAKMRGIYASEGWFMKLLEGDKKYVVKDPRKAHLFFLPFSPLMLRTVLYGQKLHSLKDLEGYLKNYVDLVARKYSFWNRTGGADHFLVGCHDWAARITSHHMNNCTRVLCNADISKGFKIGWDATLPVTSIRSAESPLRDLGGKPPSQRSILAFFAGGLHGYFRPIMLQHWENKEPDMKIVGPMPRDEEGKRLYREYMKSSKYCICARGYEVHTPRIVEAIMYGCVPVVISDNYVPPFFEVLNWEEFSVFVEERDVGNLRNILVSISEEKYVAMHLRVKMVRQHFLWHKIPVKYDLFHMVLHSVWYNRIFQMQS